MTRLLLAAAAVTAGLSGCASPARYVEKGGDSGVIAIPNNTDAWPTYNRREAIALIRKHVGPDFEIVEEREVATGQKTFNNQETNNEQTFNRTMPLLPANKQTTTTTTTTADVTEWRIAYRKRAGLPLSHGTMGPGGVVQQTQYVPGSGTGVTQAGGIVPNVGPGGGVIPAGGVPGGAAAPMK